MSFPRTGLRIAVLLVIVILAAECGSPAPASVPTQAPAATATPVPPAPPAATATPIPPSPTAAAPQNTPAPTPVPPAPTPPPAAAPTFEAHPGLPLVTFASKSFVGAGNCAVCHTGIADASGKDVSFDTQLRSSMMANSARDPYWQAQVESEVERFPALQATIEGKCVICHMPMAHTEAEATGGTSALLGNGFLNPDNALHKAAMDGNSCSFCHQMQPTNFGKAESFSGGYVIDTTLQGASRPAFGAFGGQNGQVMAGSVKYTPMQGEHITRSEMCATCHTLYTPFVDARGNIKGDFPEQTPYLEWQHSEFGMAADKTECQECHMPAAQGQVALAVMPRNLTPRSPVRQHTFTGANTLMLKMHRANVSELELTSSTDHLGQALAETETLLGEQAAGIVVADGKVTGDTLTLTVRVENKSGHKFPTSFPSRRAWIHLTVTDASGKVVFESGKPQADGSIAGCDADADAKAFEPHYDTISSPDQVQIYEPILGDTDGNVTYTLLRGGAYLKDNRVLPRGFDKATADKDFAVYGSAAEDGTFVGGSDQVTYQVPVTGFAGPFQVSADVLYQAVSYRFAEDLRGENGALSQQFMKLWDAADKMPGMVASTQTTVQ